jgi:hypothetical protein
MEFMWPIQVNAHWFFPALCLVFMVIMMIICRRMACRCRCGFRCRSQPSAGNQKDECGSRSSMQQHIPDPPLLKLRARPGT